MTRDIPIWAEVAAADRFSADVRQELAAVFARTDAQRTDVAGLVTCHRVERYGVGDAGEAGHIVSERGNAAGLPSPMSLHGEASVRHLVRLAVGLESAILGEDQVLHQIRIALGELCDRHADPRLIRLFELAVGAGRRARANYPSADRNLGELAVRWLERRVGPLRARPVVVAGAGPMGRLAAGAFARRGAAVTVASRSLEHARSVAERVGGRATDLVGGVALASESSGVIVALRGPWDGFAPLVAVPVVDLSFPLAVPPIARERLDDALADVDRIFREAGSLQPDGTSSGNFRAGAEAIVDEAVAAYRSWSAGRPSVSTLRSLRERSDAHRRVELERLLRRLPELDPRERALVEAFSERLVAGLLHEPSAALRDDVDGSAAGAAIRLFGL